MRIVNPSLRKVMQRSQAGEMCIEVQPATYGGIAKKTILFGAVTILAAILSVVLLNVAFAKQDAQLLMVVLTGALLCAIPMIVVSLVIAFRPDTVKVLGFVYSLLQGALLGVLVFFVDSYYPGIALAAVLGTLIVFVVCASFNKMLEVRVSGKFVRIMLIAFASFIALELVLMLLSLFVPNLQALFTVYLWVQLLINICCIFYATVLLLWDLQTAEDIVNGGADKKYEWIVAYSLVTTLVYLYIQILELLLRLLILFGRRN